ncbi:haspin kinase [Trichoderma arundinaceum]|uniref:non-specific serine/threonine protein kinase n=1 Tax=Trichoderma arundinaceum TaxID=490622 RepID=A0A395NTA5_TRIAR|nr:haspin kinase [Trichoderma arundinaceum]
MTRTTATRQYGKQSKKSKAERMFAELVQSPVRERPAKQDAKPIDDQVSPLTKRLSEIQLQESPKRQGRAKKTVKKDVSIVVGEPEALGLIELKEDSVKGLKVATIEEDVPTKEICVLEDEIDIERKKKPQKKEIQTSKVDSRPRVKEHISSAVDERALRVLTWSDVCPPGDQIAKIAEASSAEVYRITNKRGTSIIKAIRLPTPIKALTKAQVASGLVDEEPHSEGDVNNELQIAEWLADIPGFAVYKQRYIVQGKTTRELLETHQAIQKKMKREDPGRAQYYPSPSRYLDDTKFLVVELGDAGKSLENWQLDSVDQLWDIFLLEAIALARAEEVAMFEHRDLHEGNLCVKQARPPRQRDSKADGFFGYSGLEITILDYGLSRAEDLTSDDSMPIVYDLERDLSLFTSTYNPQCKVYRQMRSFLLRADRDWLPPEAHHVPYAKGIDGPLSWDAYVPYTNVLWLAYTYEYMVDHFEGNKKELTQFKKDTAELWKYLNPDAPKDVPSFGCAADVACFALEAGWIREDQLLGASASLLERGDSIIVSRKPGDVEAASPRRSRRGRGS